MSDPEDEEKSIGGHSVEFALGRLLRARRHLREYWEAWDDWPANRQGSPLEQQPDESD